MLKTLIKKQFMECFRTYFVNRKTGKRRSKAGIAGMFVLFAFVMLFLCAVFFGLACLMGEQLFQVGMGWLFFVLMGTLSVILGTFGSVFNTYSSLYLAKDNELLLSMPIPPSRILITRMVLVFGLSLMYSGCVWIPAIVYAWIFGSFSPAAILFQVLLIGIIALFVTGVTCVLGWAVALIATRIKRKSFIVMLASLAFVGIYYYLCFNMMGLVEKLLMNAEAVGEGMRVWANILYQLGRAADGSVSAMAIFTGVTVALFVICFWMLSRSFLHITTKTQGSVRRSSKLMVKTAGVRSALNRRELRRFTSSPTYMLNCGLGLILLPMLAVFTLIKRDALTELLSGFGEMLPWLDAVLPMAIVLMVGFCAGMNAISAPSVSLEGKNLWILQSLPVSGKMVLRAKLRLHVGLNLLPVVLTTAILGWSIGLGVWTIVLSTLLLVVMVWFFGAFGLVLGVKHPNLDWTNETMPIKQSLNVMICVLLAFVLPLLTAAGGYFTRNTLGADAYLAAVSLLLLLVSLGMSRWLDTKGAARLETL